MLVQAHPSLAYSFRQYAREFAGTQGARGAPALHERHYVVLELAAALARSAPHLAQITGAQFPQHGFVNASLHASMRCMRSLGFSQ